MSPSWSLQVRSNICMIRVVSVSGSHKDACLHQAPPSNLLLLGISQGGSPWRSRNYLAQTFTLHPRSVLLLHFCCGPVALPSLALPPRCVAVVWLLLLWSSWPVTDWHYYCGLASPAISSIILLSLSVILNQVLMADWLDTHQTPFSLRVHNWTIFSSS